MLGIVADLGAGHASVGDDVGTIHCARRSAAYIGLIIANAKDLSALGQKEPA